MILIFQGVKMKNMKKFISIIGLCATVCLATTSCGLFNGGTPQAIIDINAAQYLNPDITGRSSPVVLTIYILKTPFKFNQADYYALAENSAKALGDTLIDKETRVVRPNSRLLIKMPLATNAEYLAVTASYRNINNTKWRRIVKLSKDKTTKIKLDLESQGLVINNK